MLLFGVATFSVVMGIFLGILDKVKEVNSELEDAAGLSKFMDVLKKFNHDKPISSSITLRIEKYFEYRW
jgi:hypothetical protein